MKRFHVHVSVTNLDESIAFYNQLFCQQPVKIKPDYAKWMLDDPHINFAISSRGHATGVDHLGFQFEQDDELSVMKQTARQFIGEQIIEEDNTVCCYANSNKYWTVDPQGLAWEHFTSSSDSPVFGDDTKMQAEACCIPLNKAEGESITVSGQGCCSPNENSDCC